MTQEFDFFTKDATFGDLLDPAMKIAKDGDTEKAKRYVEAYVEYLMAEWGRSEEVARATVASNVGYYAGYYSYEQMDRVKEVFGFGHPVFDQMGVQ